MLGYDINLSGLLNSILTGIKRHTGPRDHDVNNCSCLYMYRLYSPEMATPVAENAEYLQSNATQEMLEKLAWKKEILKSKKLFEATTQVPSPSKDFVNLVITEKGVVWRRWKITIRGVTQGAAPVPMPKEEAMTHEDFQYAMEDEVERIFGPEVLRQIKRIIAGSRDELSMLPKQTMMAVATSLDLESITQLSQVNRHLREVCNSNSLWEQLYHIHQGMPSEEVTALAKDGSWKKVFFMNKLQLQKELSRRRRIHSPLHSHASNGSKATANGSNGHQPPSTTFLTQNI